MSSFLFVLNYPNPLMFRYLPNQASPTLCGRVTRSMSVAGAPLGEFVYQKAYLQDASARSLDPVLLPLKNSSYESTALHGHFSVLLDAGPDSWGAPNGKSRLNCLANNLDDHDLNHGFFDLGKGFELSPLFDVAPQRPTDVRLHLAFNLGEFGDEASKENLLSECDRFGLSTSEADQIIESLRAVVKSNWEKCLLANGVSSSHIERISSACCPEHFDFCTTDKHR